MGNYERAITALRAANAAGNTADAQRLAVIADGLRGQKTGALPFVNRAIAASLGAPVDVAQAAINLIPGVDIRGAFGGSESIERGFRALGIELPEEGQAAQTLPQQVGAGVGEVASLLVPSTLVARGLARGAGLTARVAKGIFETISRQPVTTAAGELTAGVGVGAGRFFAEDESPVVRSLAEIGGGLVGGLVPSGLARVPSVVGLRFGARQLRKASLPFTKEGARFRAGEFLKGRVKEPGEVAELVVGETIGDLPPVVASGERRLVSLFKQLRETDPTLDGEAIERIGNSIVKLESELRKIGFGSPEALRNVSTRRMAVLEARMNKRTSDAMEIAQRKLDDLPVSERRGKESVIVRDELDKVMTASSDKNTELWAAVDKSQNMNVVKSNATYEALLKDTPRAQRGDIPAILKNSVVVRPSKARTPKNASIGELQGLRAKLGEVSRMARSRGQFNKARIADEMSEAILDDMGAAADSTGSQVGETLRVAISATRRHKERFRTGVVGKILGFSGEGAPAISPELTLDISIGRLGQRGAVDISKVAPTPEAIAATERYIARSFTDFATDITTGQIVPSRAAKWVRSNEAILDQFPQLRSQMASASEAQKLATRTMGIMDARIKRIQDPRISATAKFLKSDPGNEIRDALRSPEASKRMGELVRLSRKDKSGEALEGLRGAFVDHIIEKSTLGGFNEVGERTLSGGALLGFLKANKSSINRVFGPTHIVRMKRIGRELAALEATERAKPAQITLEQKDFTSNMLRLVSRVGGAQFGRFIARVTGGGTVQTPGIFSERFKNFANNLTKDRAAQLINDAITSPDPKLLESLLLPIKRPELAAIDKNLSIIGNRMNLWLLGSGARVLADIEDEIATDTQPELAGP